MYGEQSHWFHRQYSGCFLAGYLLLDTSGYVYPAALAPWMSINQFKCLSSVLQREREIPPEISPGFYTPASST